MKSVLISIQPKWCELIANGKKTVEVRKTKPKIDTPFKCYIYETKTPLRWNKAHNNIIGGEGGYIIGEFVCDEIKDCREVFIAPTCLTTDEWLKYTDGYKRKVWGWHISDLVIYDKPRELREFWQCGGTFNVERDNIDDIKIIGRKVYKPITRPPQSWCYVESEDKK